MDKNGHVGIRIAKDVHEGIKMARNGRIIIIIIIIIIIYIALIPLAH